MKGKPEDAEGKAVQLQNWLEATEEADLLIDQRAYEIWDENGRPEGSAEANRVQAEKELFDLARGAAPMPPARPGGAPR